MDLEVIWVSREGKYFCKGGWTGGLAKHEVICPSGTFVDLFQQIGAHRHCEEQRDEAIQSFLQLWIASLRSQ